MDIAEHADERGAFLIATCVDGQQFAIDPQDFPILGGHSWRIYASRGYESCKYVTRSADYDPVTKRSPTVMLHREIMRPPEGMTVDHEDWNGLNNRRYNLRIATVHQNHSHVRFERGGRGKLPKSGLRGAYQDEWGCWYSTIAYRGTQRYIGRFDSAIDAARGWDKAARALRGEFTYLNFPGEVSP